MTRHGQVEEVVALHRTCRCGALVAAISWRAHLAEHQREHVVWRSSMQSAVEGHHFRADTLVAPFAALTTAAQRSIKAMTPRRRRKATT